MKEKKQKLLTWKQKNYVLKNDFIQDSTTIFGTASFATAVGVLKMLFVGKLYALQEYVYRIMIAMENTH